MSTSTFEFEEQEQERKQERWKKLTTSIYERERLFKEEILSKKNNLPEELIQKIDDEIQNTKIFITYRQQICCQSQEQKLIQILETKLSHVTLDIYFAATLLGLDYKIFVSTTTSETGESISIIELKTQT
jgi:translation elongation factor EF-G